VSEETDQNKVNNTIDSITNLAKVIPIYQDAIQPAAKEVGKVLQTVGMALNMALEPIRKKVWNASAFNEFVDEDVNNKLKNTPPEDIVIPPLNVVGPAFEALRYAGDDNNLRELYANLLASSMDKTTSAQTHPSFVEILKQLTPDEAKILNYISVDGYIPFLDIYANGSITLQKEYTSLYKKVSLLDEGVGFGDGVKFDNRDNLSAYINNLSRLGLTDYSEIKSMWVKEPHDALFHQFKKNNERLQRLGDSVYHTAYSLLLTDFGKLFIDTCIIDHSTKRAAKEH